MTNELSELTQHIIDEEKRLLNMERDISSISTKLDTLDSSVSDLVAAWKAANSVVAFAKWLAGLATAVGILIMFLKGRV